MLRLLSRTSRTPCVWGLDSSRSGRELAPDWTRSDLDELPGETKPALAGVGLRHPLGSGLPKRRKLLRPRRLMEPCK